MPPETLLKQQIHFSMIRSYQAADLLTLGNAAAGTAAILSIMSYLITPESWRVYAALLLLPAALGFDIADGRVARRQKTNSMFGQELDSLTSLDLALRRPAWPMGLACAAAGTRSFLSILLPAASAGSRVTILLRRSLPTKAGKCAISKEHLFL